MTFNMVTSRIWLVASMLGSAGLDFTMMNIKMDFYMMKTFIKDSVMKIAIKAIKKPVNQIFINVYCVLYWVLGVWRK